MSGDGKIVVCTCEDITRDEIEEAVERGYETTEQVKRITAVTTGPCQGRYCLAPCVRLLAELTGRPPDELGTITHRPPARAVPLGALAGSDDPQEDDA